MTQNISISIPRRSISCTVDLDALIGYFSTYAFGDTVLTSSINLCVKRNKNMSDLFKCNNTRLSKSNSQKIAMIDSDLGLIDVYLLTSKTDQEVFNAISSTIQSLSNLSRQFITVKDDIIEGSLLQADHNCFFQKLSNLDNDLDSIFIESFGNKNKTTVDLNNWDLIFKRLYAILNRKNSKKLFIDVCFSLFYDGTFITFPNISFFNSLNLVPTHKPFFADIMNLSKSCIRKETGKSTKMGKAFNCTKINFYSTFKTLFPMHHIGSSPLSSAMALTSLYDCSVTGSRSKLLNLVNNETSVVEKYNDRSSKNFPFRLEFRCKSKNVKKIYKKIKPVIENKYFERLRSNEFVNKCHKTVSEFVSYITLSGEDSQILTFDKLFESSLIEKVYQDRFVRGTKVTGIASQDFLERINTENDSLLLASLIRCYKGYTKEFKIKVLNNLIVQGYSKRADYEISIMKIAVNAFYNSAEENITEALFSACLVRYNTDENALKSDQVCEETADFNTLIHSLLYKNEKKKKSTPLIIMCNMIEHRFKVKNIIERLKTYCIESSIKFFYDSKNRIVSLNFQDSCQVASEKIICLDKFKSLSQNLKYNCLSKIDRDEMIRFLCGMYKYKDSATRFVSLRDDFAFCFFFRSSSWLKNRMSNINSILNDKNRYLSMMREVKKWKPSDFDIEDRVRYLEKLNVTLSHDQMTLFKKLVSLDSLNHNLDLSTASFSEIFTTCIASGKKNEIDLLQLLDLDKEDSCCYPILNDNFSIDNDIIHDPKALIQTEMVPETINTDSVDNENLFEPSFEYNCIDLGSSSSTDINVLPIVSESKVERSEYYPKIGCEEYDKYLTLIYKKYGFEEFSATYSRKILFPSSKRPDPLYWQSFLESMVDLDFIAILNSHKSGHCQLNLMSLTHKKIKAQFLLKICDKVSFARTKKFTASLVRKQLYLSLRPDLNCLIAYLDSSNLDSVLLSDKIGKKVLYRFKH